MWTEQECMDCQWCCRVSNDPIPGGIEYVYLYYMKGYEIYWEPYTKEWYTISDKPCQYIGLNGCKIQSCKPPICKQFYCPWGPIDTEWRYSVLCAAGKRIMQRLIERGDFNGHD